MLKLLALVGIEPILNTVMGLDPQHRSYLAGHDGKVVQVKLLNDSFFFRIDPERLTLLSSYGDVPTLTIRLRLHDTPDIAGDAELAYDLKRFLNQFNPHWQDHLAPLLGDSFTEYLDQGWQALHRWLGRAKSRTQTDLTAYLQEERRLVPPREELEDFYEDIALLRQKLEHLEVRMSTIR